MSQAPSQPRRAPIEVVDDDPEPGDAGHLGQDLDRRIGLQVVDQERGVRDVEGAIRIRDRSAVADLMSRPVDGHRCRRRRRSGQPRRSRAGCRCPRSPDAAPDLPRASRGPGGCPRRRSRRRATSASSTVGRQRFDGSGAEPDAAQKPVDPAQVAQVAGEGVRVVERSVEELDPIGETLHGIDRARALLKVLPTGAWPRSPL